MTTADKLAQVLAEHKCRVVEFDGCVCNCGTVVTPSVNSTTIKEAWAKHQAAVVLAHLAAEGWTQGREEWGFSLSVYAEGNVALARSKEAAEKAANAWPNLDPKLYRRRVTDWEPADA